MGRKIDLDHLSRCTMTIGRRGASSGQDATVGRILTVCPRTGGAFRFPEHWPEWRSGRAACAAKRPAPHGLDGIISDLNDL